MEDSFKRRPNEISLSRVKTIMKSSPEVENVSQESVFLVTKATEMFIKHMVEEAFNASGNAETLDYRHISELVDSTEELFFLREIVPMKTTLREIEEYQRENELKIERPGTSPTCSDVSFSSDDDKDLEVATSPVPSSKSKDTPLSSKETTRSPEPSSHKFGHETFVDSSPSMTRSGTSPQTKGGPTRTNVNTSVVDKVGKGKKTNEESLEMESDADSSTEVSTGKCVVHEEMLASPMSIISVSSESRTPSPSPSYSSLSPDANSVVHVDVQSSHSSDCEIVE